MYKNLIKPCSIFYKLRRILPLKVLKQVYIVEFAYCHILYVIEIYGNIHKSYLDKHKLIKLNNKLRRIIQNKNRRTHIPVLELYMKIILYYMYYCYISKI